MKKLLAILAVLTLFSCSKDESERIPTGTYYDMVLANTTWKGKRMSIEFVSNDIATITNNLSYLKLDTFNVTYVVNNNHIGMMCKDFKRYDLGINIENGYFISREKMTADFVFILTNEGIIDTISYTENFVKQ
jgi:hypothetical protein